MASEQSSNKLVDEIKSYWDMQAELARDGGDKLLIIDLDRNVFSDSSGGGTLKDWRLRELEIQAFANYISVNDRVLDIGCGNGFSTVQLSLRTGCAITGLDYSERMIENAMTSLKVHYADMTSRVNYLVGDVLNLATLKDGAFNVVLTERCLINLVDWESQQSAIRSIANILEPGGLFLMLEGSLDGLQNLNRVRRDLDLPDIKSAWHNQFIADTKLQAFSRVYFDLLTVDNFCSTYMLISRALHPKLVEPDQPTYDAKINDIAMKLPNEGEYGYLKLHVFKRRPDD